MLQELQSFLRPVRTIKLHVRINPGHVLRLDRQPLNQQVQRILLVPDFAFSPQLQMLRIARLGHFKVPLPKSDLRRIQDRARRFTLPFEHPVVPVARSPAQRIL